jgi:hypothetical protein
MTTDIASGAKTNFAIDVPWLKGRNFHWRHVKGLITIFKSMYYEAPSCRVCHYDVHSNQQAQNTEYWYWPPGGTDWVVSNTPPSGVKTHLVNFAPTIIHGVLPYPMPIWYVNLDSVPHLAPILGTNVDPGERACALMCHFNGGDAMMLGKYGSVPGDDIPTY